MDVDGQEMSISTISTAFTAQLGNAGSFVTATMAYLDGGRLQLLAFTFVSAAGLRQTITRVFQSSDDLTAGAKQMAIDWIAGTLQGA